MFSTSTPEAAQWDREWGLRSVHHMLSLLLVLPHTLPLHQCEVPPTGDSQWEGPTSPVWVLPVGCRSSLTAPAWVLLMGAVLQEQAAPVWVPHGVTGPARRPFLVCAPLHRPQVLAGTCSSTGSPWDHCLTCSTMDLHGLQGHSLPHYGLLHGLQGNLCSGAWSSSSTPSALTSGSAELFLSHSLTPLSRLLLCSIF